MAIANARVCQQRRRKATTISDLKYLFRANPGIGRPERIEKFKKMMKKNVQEIFNSNQTIFKNLNKVGGIGKVEVWEDLLDLLNSPTFNQNNSFFDFIEVN